MHRLPDSAARHELVRGPSHIKAITGEYCKTEYAILLVLIVVVFITRLFPDIILFPPDYLK
jgi:hypothetical protein